MSSEKHTNNIKKVRDALNKISKAKKQLRELDALRSERFTGEIGEWFAEQLTNAKRVKSRSQVGCDLTINETKIQVKTHAKGDNNAARWTTWSYDEKKPFDVLIILVFSKDFYLKEAYRMTYEQAKSVVDRKLQRPVIRWNDCKKFAIKKIPNELNHFVNPL